MTTSIKRGVHTINRAHSAIQNQCNRENNKQHTTKGAEQARGPDAENLGAESLRCGRCCQQRPASEHAKSMPDMATEKRAKVKHDATKDARSRGHRGHEQSTKAAKEMNECNAVVEQTSTSCVQVETVVRLRREVLLPIWLRRPGTVRLHKLAALPPHRESSTSVVAGKCLAERAHGNVFHPRSVASFVPQGNGIKAIRSPVRRCVVRSERRGRACVVCVVTVSRVESGGDVGSRGPEI
jgi:hypothetical protein